MRDRPWIMEALPHGQGRAHGSQGVRFARAGQPALRSSGARALGRPLAPAAVGEGAMSAAAMAPGGAAGGGSSSGGGSSGDVLHFVGSCCGELGTN